MATRRSPPKAPPPTDDETGQNWGVAIPSGAGTADEDEPEETPTDRVRTMLSQVGDDAHAKVSLFRVDKITKKQSWCDDYLPAEFETGGLAAVRERWGPGTYAVRLYGTKASRDGRVQTRALAEQIITIETGPVPRVPQASESPVNELAQVLRAMQEQQTTFQNQLLQAVTHRPDPQQAMRDTLSLMAAMREAMGLNNQPPPAPTRSSIGEVIEAVKELRSVAGELIPADKPDPDNLLSMLPMLLETIKAATAGRTPTEGTATLPATPALPSLTLAHPAPAPVPAQTEAEKAAMLKMIADSKARLAELLRMATSGATPADGGAFLIEHLPDEMIDPLCSDEWFDLLCHFAPECKTHETWVRAARQVAYDEFTRPDDAASVVGNGS